MSRVRPAIQILPALWATAIVATMPATSAAGAPQIAAARSCGAAWSTVATKNPSDTAFLYSVDGVAMNDVWAVGDWSEEGSLVQTQIQRWNGTGWNIVPSPSPGTIGASLGGVDAISANNAWAVGEYIDDEDASRTLVERWNGSAWTVVPSPNQGVENNVLSDVAAVGPSDVWAVGNYLDAATGNYRTLSLHWNGAMWSVVPSPSVGTGENNLTAVAARSADDVWAVGYRFDPAVGAYKTLILHWNGSAWSVVASPNPAPSGDNQLFGVTAFSATGAWAVGYHRAADVREALIARWNGTAWTVSPSPDPGTVDNQLFGIAALAAGDAWTVGTYATNAVREPLAEHWDGQAWSVASTPTVGSGNGAFVTIQLSDLTVIGSQVWAVGFRSVPGVGIQTLAERVCPVQVLDSGFSPKTVTVTHGETVAWSLPATNAQGHSITDETGMGLFDSGVRAPGSRSPSPAPGPTPSSTRSPRTPGRSSRR
jgi:hypothetical protein